MPKQSSSSVRVFYPKFNKRALIIKLKEKLQNLSKELPIVFVVLFGSYAQGKSTVASDIDLLVVYEGQEKPEAFSVVKRTLDIPLLEPHVYSKAQYRKLKDTIDRMIADGETLYSKKG